MYNWVGKYKTLMAILIVFVPAFLFAAAQESLNHIQSAPITDTVWETYNQFMQKQAEKDYEKGISYIISGSLALAGGLIGESVTNDNLEKATYTVFQTIGVASIGFGAYAWKVGDEDRDIYISLSRSRLTPEERIHFLKIYKFQKKETEKKEKNIKAITHILIAALNIYNGTQQKNESIKNGLYFIGGINLLASASYTFEF